MDRASGETWRKFDRRLFDLKLHEPSRQMQTETAASRRKIYSEHSRSNSLTQTLFIRLIDADLVVLRRYLENVDRICREVWQTQQNPVTPDFVRTIITETIFNTIQARAAAIEGDIDLTARRRRFMHLTPVRRHLAHAIRQLRGIVHNRYEVEAHELGYKSALGTQTLVGARESTLPQGSARPQRTTVKPRDAEVAKRRAIVRSHPEAIARDMCEIFDRESLPLPVRWREAGLRSWANAYKRPDYRRRIDVLISKDRWTST
jgi:hypothetical protein